MTNTQRQPIRWAVVLGLSAVLTMLTLTARAGQEEVAQKPPMGPPSTENGDDNEKEKPEFPEWEKVSEDFKEILGPQGSTGVFPLFYNEKEDKLLCVVPQSMIGKNFLLASSIAGGPFFAGWMWEDKVVQWQEQDKKLVLIEPDLRYKDGGKEPVADAIQRTYTDRILLATRIITKRGGDPVIDLGDIFKKDFARIGRLFGGSMNAELSRWVKYKAFPQNCELAVDAAIMQPSGDGGIRARVHFSLIELPPVDNGYQPREADTRVGYFLTAVKDFTQPHDKDTIFKRYIHRWNLKKAEPDKAVSDVDPDSQIVFYIEKTVPVQYRRWVREGILMWNRAFEKAGFRNAVRVEQQTDTVHADKDPEDVRYSFFRWIVSGRSFAMGPSRANPLTGQILDADIIFDDSMARVWEMRYAKYTATGLAGAEDPHLQTFLDKHPEWKFVPVHERLLPESTHYSGVELELSPDLHRQLAGKHGYCNYASGLAHELAFHVAALEAQGKGDQSEEFVGQMIKEVTAHEVGHTLGLRHNFKASSWKSIEEILASTDPAEPNCGSVMDYNAGMFNPNQEKQGLFVMQAVGPYDEWAIEYGYATHEGTEYKSDEELLKSVTSRVAEEGLAYATDEDTIFFSPDPLSNRFDNGSDVIEFAKHRIDMVRRLQKDMTDWAVKEGEDYHKLRRTFDMLLFEYAHSAYFSARYVGGQYVSRDHKGDPNGRLPFEIVPVTKQREALDFLMNTIFSDRDFQFDPELINKLAAGRWWHWESDALDSQLEYPIHDRIAAMQWFTLFQVLNPFTLNRIYDAQLKVPADDEAITVPELLNRVTQAVWTEVEEGKTSENFTNRKPMVSSVRRSLQRQHLQMLLNLILAEPGSVVAADIQAVAALTLRDLSKQIGTILEKKGIDDFTRAHLDESKSRMDRALEAEYRL